MITSNHPQVDYRSLLPATVATLDEIIRQSELRIAVQIQLALAADGRAGLLASLQSTASVALLIASFSDIKGPAAGAAVGAAAALGVAACLSAWAAQPVSFGLPGTKPGDWVDSISVKKSLHTDKAEYAAHLDKYLTLNSSVMAENCNWVRISMVATAFAPIAALLGALLLPGGPEFDR